MQNSDQNISQAPRRIPDIASWPSWLDWLILTILTASGIGITVLFYRFTYDDVFLAFRYAKNILAGHGFVFNPGERFLGTPAPLFVLLLVAGKNLLPWLTIPEIGGVLSGLSLTVCSVILYYLCKEHQQPIAGIVASLLSLFSPLVVMTLGGETPIYLMLVCAAFYTYARSQYNLSAFLLALATLNRSEGIIAAGAMWGHYLVARRRLPIRPPIVYLLTLLPWFIYATIYFGSPLTNSLGAKIAQRQVGAAHFILAAAYWVRHPVFHNRPWPLALLLLAALGAIVIVREWRRWSALFAWMAAQSLGYLVLDVPFYHWYIAHIGIGISVAAGLGLSWAMQALLLRRKQQWTHWLSLAGRLLLVLLVCAIIAASVSNVQGYWRWLSQPSPSNQLYTETGKWLKEHTPPGSSVAYLEIGQIGYYSDRQIIDLLGLVTPGAAARLGQGNFYWVYQMYEPDYVLYNPLFAPWTYPPIAQPWFQESYEAIAELNEPRYPFQLTVYHRREGTVIPSPVETDVAQTRLTTGVPLHKDAHVGQTFEALSPNLCGVQVVFLTPETENQQRLVFHLTSGTDPTHDLVRYEIPPGAIKDNVWHGIFFPPLSDSEGQTYQFHFEAPEIPEAEALVIQSSGKDTYGGGTILLNGHPGKNDLAFSTFICPSQAKP
jgi:hypothetical protein